ncbi:hypothetical protein H6G89_32250 [Oscillatoria sp. FACHB-1407]|uniref:hypothetical protein n=1 Tax=Oscillatoria sp. FACHB-1407 TaxID=2692847 RepID=UPI0016832082|nr:hypothetical protein [Oscillatoria sp. FACHB-1407]MBD2465665.1 hypothetical protein [Oscillatoria sp. FACHB-1407]
MAVQVLQPPDDSLKELTWRLSSVRGKRVPGWTLCWWLEHLHIEPNEYGLYLELPDLTSSSLVIVDFPAIAPRPFVTG